MRACGALLLLGCLLLGGAAAQADWAVDSASRRINLKSAWAKVVDTVKLTNKGKGAAGEFVACYPEALGARIALLKVLVKKERQEVAAVAPPAGAPPGVSCFAAALKAPVKKGGSVELDVVATITGVFSPNPAKIAQGETQYVEYRDNAFLLSPYTVAEQTTVVLLPTSDVKSFAPSEDASKGGSKVTFGKFGKQGPWAVKELKVHFAHDRPFKRINSLVREIEVSHWGNIYVEEVYEIQNAGAEHTGKFSRLNYAHSPNGKGNSFPVRRLSSGRGRRPLPPRARARAAPADARARACARRRLAGPQDVVARLPGPAHSLYYKDIIGNISSSDTTHSPSETSIEIRLRYPLMGGWKTDFTLGYSLPLEGFLYRRPKGKLRLLMDFSTSFDDVWVERLTTRVVLPEGAKNIKPTLPFDGVEQGWDKKFTYLDTAGRPTLVLTKANVVPEHNKPFAVDYAFTFGAMMREPLLLISVFAAFFAAVSLYNRLDFTITKDERWLEGQARDRALGVLQQLAALWDEEAELVDKVVGLAHSISDAASAEAAHVAKAGYEAKIKDVEGQAKALLRQLEDVSAKSAAAARDHADKSKALLQRAAKLVRAAPRPSLPPRGGMGWYELLALARPTLGRPELAQLMGRVGELVAARGGVVTDVASYGEQALAYRIRGVAGKFDKAHIVQLDFAVSPAALQDIAMEMRVNEDVLRWVVKRRALPTLPQPRTMFHKLADRTDLLRPRRPGAADAR
ncbi:OST1A [Scenedesmus sp. PABB004]|nr:OST1A [Scenedesmus sp. PABB004]